MSLKRFRRALVRWLSLLVIVSFLFIFGLYLYRMFAGYQYDSSLEDKDLAAGVKADEGITNIALFGLDTREGETASHSDSMMIVAIDNVHHKIKLISLMRDSLVDIEGVGKAKLNSAYFTGGAALAIRTINQIFRTDITDYIAVEFRQVAAIVDALGGVEIDVKNQNEVDELNRVLRDYGLEQGREFQPLSAPGLQKLNGAQALCYSRIRKGGTGDDWARVERQSAVLQAIFQNVQEQSASTLLLTIQKLLPNITTSLSIAEIAPLVVGALQNGVPAIEHVRIPLDGEWEYAGASSEYIVYDTDAAAETIRKYIYDDIMPGSPAGETSDVSSGVMGGIDFDAPPSAPVGVEEPETGGASSNVGADSSDDPASLAESGGSYNAATGDYRDSDGDYYRLDENGNRVYYDQAAYRAKHGLD